MKMTDKTIDNLTFTKYDLDCYTSMMNYRYIGQHLEYKVYGHQYDRIAFKRIIDYKGIRYEEQTKHQGEKYIEPLSFKPISFMTI